MVITVTSFLGTSQVFSQSCCPPGWASSIIVVPTSCGVVEATVCCAPPGTVPAASMIVCGVETPNLACKPATALMFQEVSDYLVTHHHCGFTCNQPWYVNTPCQVREQIIIKNGVPWVQFIPCDSEPCVHIYTVECDDWNNVIIVTKTVDPVSCNGSIPDSTCTPVCNK